VACAGRKLDRSLAFGPVFCFDERSSAASPLVLVLCESQLRALDVALVLKQHRRTAPPYVRPRERRSPRAEQSSPAPPTRPLLLVRGDILNPMTLALSGFRLQSERY
jgi:hypothetical protein